MRIAAVFAAVVSTLAVRSFARAEPPPSRSIYSIAIGQNGIPHGVHVSSNDDLVALRYADDDAAAFHAFMRDMSRRAYLFAVLDTDTQQRFPDLVASAQAPVKDQIIAAVAAIRRSMKEDAAAGRQPIFVFFYSGHGIRDASGAAALSLLDGAISQRTLYDQILSNLPAGFTHVFIDACHAEAVIRPRDMDAKTEAVSVEAEGKYLQEWTLARFPRVGVVLAASSDAQSFEWEGYHGGVFTHEVLSGLRGAADVNADGLIEYSELAAFLAAANRRISDARVRPQIVVQAPRADGRVPIIDVGDLRNHFRLKGHARGHWSTPFYVETEGGVRLIDVHPEPGARVSLSLPSGRRLRLVQGEQELEFSGVTGNDAMLEEVQLGRSRATPRGPTAAMRAGLFAAAYGPGFYEGYMSLQPDMVPVGFVSSRAPGDGPAAARPISSTRRAAGISATIVAGVGVVVTGVSGVLALRARSRYEGTDIEREATEARRQVDVYSQITGIAGGATALFGVVGAALLLGPTFEHAAGPPVYSIAFTGQGLAVAGHF